MCANSKYLLHLSDLSAIKYDKYNLFSGLSSPGALLFDELARNNQTCYDLKVEIESYGDPAISCSFQKCINGRIVLFINIS